MFRSLRTRRIWRILTTCSSEGISKTLLMSDYANIRYDETLETSGPMNPGGGGIQLLSWRDLSTPYEESLSDISSAGD